MHPITIKPNDKIAEYIDTGTHTHMHTHTHVRCIYRPKKHGHRYMIRKQYGHADRSFLRKLGHVHVGAHQMQDVFAYRGKDMHVLLR